MSLSFESVRKNPEIISYIRQADAALLALGYTDHGLAHVTKAAVTAADILRRCGRDEHQQQLAAIAAFMHDIGNIVNRSGHAQTGAVMAFTLLREMGGAPDDIATIVAAIGNHDEGTATPINDIAAALILADKSDVRSTRVRNRDTISFDIHDRVNWAVREADLIVNGEGEDIVLKLSIDTQVSAISEYFEIFLSRMLLCRRAAEKLQRGFALIINDQKVM